jgi:uncharacterized membrane protein
VTLPRTGLLAAGLAFAGFLVALYLTWTKLAGELPVCGAFGGCDTVALSEYSVIFGVPVALLGALFSALVFALAVGWWRRGDRKAILGAYGLGLFGILFVGYLTYLELFVIEAICIWCVTYGVTVVAGWVMAAIALRSSGAAA